MLQISSRTQKSSRWVAITTIATRRSGVATRCSDRTEGTRTLTPTPPGRTSTPLQAPCLLGMCIYRDIPGAVARRSEQFKPVARRSILQKSSTRTGAGSLARTSAPSGCPNPTVGSIAVGQLDGVAGGGVVAGWLEHMRVISRQSPVRHTGPGRGPRRTHSATKPLTGEGTRRRCWPRSPSLWSAPGRRGPHATSRCWQSVVDQAAPGRTIVPDPRLAHWPAPLGGASESLARAVRPLGADRGLSTRSSLATWPAAGLGSPASARDQVRAVRRRPPTSGTPRRNHLVEMRCAPLASATPPQRLLRRRGLAKRQIALIVDLIYIAKFLFFYRR